MAEYFLIEEQGLNDPNPSRYIFDKKYSSREEALKDVKSLLVENMDMMIYIVEVVGKCYPDAVIKETSNVKT